MKRQVFEFLDSSLHADWQLSFYPMGEAVHVYLISHEAPFSTIDADMPLIRDLFRDTFSEHVVVRMERLDVFRIYGMTPDDLLILKLRFLGKQLE